MKTTGYIYILAGLGLWAIVTEVIQAQGIFIVWFLPLLSLIFTTSLIIIGIRKIRQANKASALTKERERQRILDSAAVFGKAHNK